MTRKGIGLQEMLAGGDRRSIGQVPAVIDIVVAAPERFAELFEAMLANDPVVRMRAADAVEKVTRSRPGWLSPYQKRLIEEIAPSDQQEIRWHAALMLPRLKLTARQRRAVLEILAVYLEDQSKIVKTNAMQALADLATADITIRPAIVEKLRRLTRSGSAAMRARGRKLLSALETDAPKPNVILTGFMGTGKSTIGKLLASELEYEFVDTDTQIVARAGCSVAEIFEQEGEAVFRRLESELAEELAQRRGLVIATGGGLMLDAGNAAALGQSGSVFCLTATPDEIIARVSTPDSEKRPLLETPDPLQRIKALLRQRRAGYARFEQVDTTGRTVAALVQQLLGALSEQALQ